MTQNRDLLNLDAIALEKGLIIDGERIIIWRVCGMFIALVYGDPRCARQCSCIDVRVLFGEFCWRECCIEISNILIDMSIVERAERGR